MITFLRDLMTNLEQHWTRNRTDAQPPIEKTLAKWDRVEHKLDAMIVEKAGQDFLERALMNREGMAK
jgi:hypothetical protein